MSGLDYFGAATLTKGESSGVAPRREGSGAAPRVSLRTAGIGLAAGITAAVTWRAHPVLGFFLGSAAAGNVAAVASGELDGSAAARSAGCVVAATVAALAVPSEPAVLPPLAWVGALVASDMVFGGALGAVQRQMEEERARELAGRPSPKLLPEARA